MKSSDLIGSPEARSSDLRAYATRLQRLLSELPFGDVASAIELLESAYLERRAVFIAGNGGSAATASHMATDLAKTAARGGAGFRVIALTDNTPLLTAIGNDLGYASVFSFQLRTLAQSGDLLIVVSGSGDSPNILEALETAAQLNMTTISLLGRRGGKAAGKATVDVIVPADEYGPIEDVHLILNHAITAYFGRWIARCGENLNQVRASL